MTRIHALKVIRLLLLTPMLLPVCGGCSSKTDGPERFQLDGAVTVKGRPVRDGTIFLSPNSDKGNSGPGSVAFIREGRYATPAGHGVVGGPYIAKIVGYDEEFDPSSDAEPPVSLSTKVEIDLPKKAGKHDFTF